jgi:hypothetical protein
MMIMNSANQNFENIQPYGISNFTASTVSNAVLHSRSGRRRDGTTFSPAGRDFTTLNLLICGNLAKGEQALKIAQFGEKCLETLQPNIFLWC